MSKAPRELLEASRQALKALSFAKICLDDCDREGYVFDYSSKSWKFPDNTIPEAYCRLAKALKDVRPDDEPEFTCPAHHEPRHD